MDGLGLKMTSEQPRIQNVDLIFVGGTLNPR